MSLAIQWMTAFSFFFVALTAMRLARSMHGPLRRLFTAAAFCAVAGATANTAFVITGSREWVEITRTMAFFWNMLAAVVFLARESQLRHERARTAAIVTSLTDG